ncbi:MAG: hypothetical protein OER95_17630, partial [Acidimicrobiia bacterium]|nr:hypothetical protein [Acidimicrobiia bacterium]
DPSPNRSNMTWTEFLQSQAAVTCDSFTVDTAFLLRYYILFFIKAQTQGADPRGTLRRRTEKPAGDWTTQAARNLFIGDAKHLEGAPRRVPKRSLTSGDGLSGRYTLKKVGNAGGGAFPWSLPASPWRSGRSSPSVRWLPSRTTRRHPPYRPRSPSTPGAGRNWPA